MLVQNIKISILNCDSLINIYRRQQLQALLNSQKPDFCLLQETWLKPIHRPKFNNYNIISNTSGRGTAILAKYKFKYKQIVLNNIHSSIDLCAVEVEQDQKPPILIMSLYTPSLLTRTQMFSELDGILQQIRHYDTFIIGGDFNARNLAWDSTNCPRGVALQEWQYDNSSDVLHLTPSLPTRPSSGSTVDHFICSHKSILRQDCNLKNITTFSDHNMITLQIKNSSLKFFLKPPPNYRNYRAADWEQFKHNIEIRLDSDRIPYNRNLNTTEIDNHILRISEIISEETERAVPRKNTIHNQIPLPEPIPSLMKQRRKFKKSLMRENKKPIPDINKRRELISNTNQINKLIAFHINKEVKINYENKIKAIKNDNNTFQEINKLTGRKRRDYITSIKTGNNITTTDPTEIANSFRDYYEELYREKPAPNPSPINTTTHLSSAIEPKTVFGPHNPATAPSNQHVFTNPRQIKEKIKKLNNKKSAGPDTISNFLIKKLPPLIYSQLAIILNNTLNLAYFPTCWKSAIIIPIKKSKTANTPNDFRPISLTNNFGKILEDFILDQLKAEMPDNSIPSTQFGFKKAHSSTDALFVLKEHITNGFNNRKVTACCFLDIRKAFDSVWVDGLSHKIKELRLDIHLTQIIQNFMENRTARILIGDTTSREIEIKTGVPQGTRLGPILYNLYTADHPIPQHPVQILQYADDTAIYSSHAGAKIAIKHLQLFLDKMVSFYQKWNIVINSDKTEFVMFHSHAREDRHRSTIKQIKEAKIVILNNTIAPKNSSKYLGITLDNNLILNKHIPIIIKKIKIATAMLRPIIKNVDLNIKIKKLLYHQLIRPLALYGVHIWCTAADTNIEKLCVQERKVVRSITGLFRKEEDRHYHSNQTIYTSAGIKPLRWIMYDTIRSNMERLIAHDNDLIKEALEYKEHQNNNYKNFHMLWEDINNLT